MIKWVLRRAIDNVERDWNYDASSMRDMIDASPRAAWLFPASPPSGGSGVTSPSRHGAPTVKYALSHGKACMRVVGTPVMFDHGRVPALVAVRTA